MKHDILGYIKYRHGAFKVVWHKLTFDQKISVSALLLLLLLITLPVGIVLGLRPTHLFSWANFPITPPITTPTSPTITTPPTPTITTALSPTIIHSPTLSPTPVRPDPSITQTPSTPTPTLAPPLTNVAPRVITSSFKSGLVGRYLEITIQAVDRNGDLLTMSASNLPDGLIFGDCNFSVNGNGVSMLSCEVKGTPTKRGLFASKFIAEDVWGAKTQKTIIFIILSRQ